MLVLGVFGDPQCNEATVFAISDSNFEQIDVETEILNYDGIFSMGCRSYLFEKVE